MKNKLYAERDEMALGQFYVDHVCAMTAEGLHEKSDIAAELAWRDARINEIKGQRDSLSLKYDELFYKLQRLESDIRNRELQSGFKR